MALEKKKILVIDDQEEIRDLVNVTLRGSEFEVFEATDGREGIQIAREHKPDLILLDVMMPGFDGFTTCKVLKRNLDTKDIPIIFLTAKKTKEDITSALKAGGTDYVVKPFSPNNLLTRVRKIVGTKELKKVSKGKKEELIEEPKKQKVMEIYSRNFTRHGDVIVCSDILKSISMENLYIYREIFANIVLDGIFKIVLDMANVTSIDGAGLSLLLSVNESLKSYGGGLRLTLPAKAVNNRYTFAKINELLRVYPTLQEAVDSYNTIENNTKDLSDIDILNVCMSCTYVNDDNARYCSFCGTNLIMGRGKDVLDVIRRSIMHRIILEAQTSNPQNINLNRNIEAEKYKVPTDFIVELLDENLTITYKSSHTYMSGFETKDQIAIEAPLMNGTVLPARPGMKVRLKTPQTGNAVVETEIKRINIHKGLIIVHYTKEEGVIHSKKNFSIAPSQPIPVNLLDPSFQYTGDILKGKILELSRVRMIVFTEERIPENICLAVSFELPDGKMIASPLVIAQRRKERYMYDIEFVIFDEKERSRMIQYMYRRQIEQAKGTLE
jgi:anti-anti-sigma factor